MTPEPLKGKKDYVIEDCKDTFFAEEDVKSAVEWLKEELKKHNDRPQYNKEWVIELINKAFEDVIK